MRAERFSFAAKWIGVAAGAGVLLWLAWISYIYLASEAVIERRYTLPSSLVHVSKDAEAPIRGKHWVKIAGCFGCHGGTLKGRLLKDNPYLTIYASNLRALTP